MVNGNYPITAAQMQAFEVGRSKVGRLLNSYRERIKDTLPDHISADSFIRSVLTAFSKEPDLMLCKENSIIGAVMQAAELGLIPGDITGECYFSADGKECLFLPGYKGLCMLAMRSGMVASIKAKAVYEGDIFKHNTFKNKFKYKSRGKIDQNKITDFFAVIHFMNGGISFDVFTREQMEGVREENEDYKNCKDKLNHVWAKRFDKMGAKHVLKELLTVVPMSAEINKAIGFYVKADAGLNQNLAIEVYEGLEDDQKLETKTDIITNAGSGRAGKTVAAKATAKNRGLTAQNNLIKKIQKK